MDPSTKLALVLYFSEVSPEACGVQIMRHKPVKIACHQQLTSFKSWISAKLQLLLSYQFGDAPVRDPSNHIFVGAQTILKRV